MLPAQVSLLGDLDAFYLEHRRCGDLYGAVEQIATEDVRVRLACSCGAVIMRSADEE